MDLETARKALLAGDFGLARRILKECRGKVQSAEEQAQQRALEARLRPDPIGMIYLVGGLVVLALVLLLSLR